MTKIKTDLRKEIIAVLDADPTLLANVLEELDDLNGYLGSDRWMDMTTLETVLSDVNPYDVAWMCYYGKDIDSWNDTASFCPRRQYFRINDLGNLESSNVRNYDGWNNGSLADDIALNWGRIDSVKGDKELLDLAIALDEAED